MAALMLLGFSSGLPFYLTNRTLQAWMTLEGINLSTIGFFSLIALPYSLKFLWSPLVDRYSFPFLGRRKGWLIVSQTALAATIGLTALAQPSSGLTFLAVGTFTIAFLSATQDITIDAYSADILDDDETGAGAGVKVLGYRIALVVTGAGALILADHWSWPWVYAAIACIMLLTMSASTLTPEPRLFQVPPRTVVEAIRLPFSEFFGRQGAAKATIILAFVVLYRLGDYMVTNMTTPFLLQTGFSQSDIGAIQGGVGLVATVGGVLLGGAVLSQMGLNRSLWVFGGLQAVSNLAYVALAQAGRNYGLMVITILVENICVGLGTAGLVGFLISLCNPRFSATQYALLSSLMAAGRDVISAPCGAIAERTGWPLFFFISFLAAAPGLALLPRFAPWRSIGNFVHTAPVDSEF